MSLRPENANPLWEFAIEFYGRDGVQSHCLDLQDQHDDDVLCLLLCCWCAVEGIELEQQWLDGVLGDAAWRQWRGECIEALRRLRRNLKHSTLAGAGDLRQRVKDLELAAEKLAVEYLHRHLGDARAAVAPSAAGLCTNLQRYRRSAALPPMSAADMLPLLRAAFPSSDQQALLQQARDCAEH